jgi:formamidopyrimidine-DNA glycosylase
MPELPEVENVRRSLVQMVVGKTIASVEVRLPRIIRTPEDTQRFAAELAGCTITSIERRGKYLLIQVPPYTLVSHLRMEGQYRLADETEPEQPHTHVVFHFTDGTALRYRDVRQFGTMDLIPREAPWPEAWPQGLAALGPEPLDADFTPADLYQRIHRRSAPIKAVLLDQTTVAGLGNIYVDEALFAAGIHPERPASQITRKQASVLHAQIQDVLRRAIDAGGSSIKTYVNGYGRHGGFQMELAVYGRAGEPCRVCGTAIEKLRVAGRGTHVCPRCQTRPRQRRAVKLGAPVRHTGGGAS